MTLTSKYEGYAFLREKRFFPHRLVIEPEREPGDGHCHGAGDVDLEGDFIFLSNNSVLLEV